LVQFFFLKKKKTLLIRKNYGPTTYFFEQINFLPKYIH
jgi:hypothetical protein